MTVRAFVQDVTLSQPSFAEIDSFGASRGLRVATSYPNVRLVIELEVRDQKEVQQLLDSIYERRTVALAPDDSALLKRAVTIGSTPQERSDAPATVSDRW